MSRSFRTPPELTFEDAQAFDEFDTLYTESCLNCSLGSDLNGSINYDAAHGFDYDYEDPKEENFTPKGTHTLQIKSRKEDEDMDPAIPWGTRSFPEGLKDPFKFWNYRIPAVVKEDFECVLTKGPIKRWIYKEVKSREYFFRLKYRHPAAVTSFPKSKDDLLAALTVVMTKEEKSPLNMAHFAPRPVGIETGPRIPLMFNYVTAPPKAPITAPIATLIKEGASPF